MTKDVSEFNEWAKRFEADGDDSAKCMYPVKEGPHKVAHGMTAHHRSIDGYPVCQHHAHKAVRPAWREYIEGA